MNESREFVNLIKDGAVGINIDDTKWGKEVCVSDNRGDSKYSFPREQLDQVKEFLTEHKEIIIEIHDVRKEYDGVDMAWNIGKIAEEYISGGKITNGDFTLITALGRSDDGTYTGQRRNVYNIFPNQEYHSEYFTQASLCELTQTVDEDSLHTINENSKKYDITVKTARLRAIRDVYSSDLDVEKSVEKALDRKRFKTMNNTEFITVLRDAHLLLGNENVSKSEIKNAL